MLAPNNSIAVLPFVNMSSDPENEYFSDGITEEIISALSKIDSLRVSARTSSFTFKGKNKDVRHIGRALGVKTILEGSVRKAEKKVRITAQLINVNDGYHFWSEHYDRKVEDIFALQDDIAQQIAKKVRAHFDHFNIQVPIFKPIHTDARFQPLTHNMQNKFRLVSPVMDQPKYAHSKLSTKTSRLIDNKLMAYMKDAKPYLDNQLSLRRLAQGLDINTNYLSQVINERHGKNFFEFINAYRVTELKEKLKNPENRQFTILSLAFDCGFNSKTTFNTAFKRITGCTPSQYLKRIA